MTSIASLQPLHASHSSLQSVRLVATDMDGTLTQQGKFTPLLLQAFHDLNQAGIAILIVTGRSAGWMNGIASYLPVMGAIAENGGVFYGNDVAQDGAAQNGAASEFLVTLDNLTEHRQRLAEIFARLQAEFPQIQASVDNAFRLTDWTFDVFGLTIEQIHQMRDRCLAQGWGFTYSTVQCHIRPLQQDKAIGLKQVLKTHFPQYQPHQVVTVGDSPNDESLFDAEQFPLSIGVANIQHYLQQLRHQPGYITQAAEAAGFAEFAHHLIQAATVSPS